MAEHVGMHAEGGAERQHEGADRAQRRPRARVDEMIGMLLRAVGHGQPPFPDPLAGVPPSKVFARSVLAS